MAVSSAILDLTGASLRSPDTKIQFQLGQRASGDYGGVYLYGTALVALAAGDVIFFDKDFNAAKITTAASPRGAKVAVAKYAMAAGQFGFFQIGGQALVNILNSVVVNARLNTTATGGAVDDDGTTTTKELLGIVLAVTGTGAGVFEGTLTEPFVNLTL